MPRRLIALLLKQGSPASNLLADLIHTMASKVCAASYDSPAAQLYFTTGEMTAIPKPNGTSRPIVRQTWARNLTTSLAASAHKEDVARFCAPHQFGIGVSGGCQLAAFTLRALRLAFPHSPHLRIDIICAFNTTFRAATHEILSRYFPRLLPLWHFLHSKQSSIIFRDTDAGTVYDITASEGGSQGCGIMSLAFAVTQHPILAALFGDLSSLGLFGDRIACVAQVDDQHLVPSAAGRPHLAGCFSDLRVRLSTIGSELQMSKTDYLHPLSQADLDAEGLTWNNIGFVAHGVPFVTNTTAGHAFEREHYFRPVREAAQRIAAIRGGGLSEFPFYALGLLTSCINTLFGFLISAADYCEPLIEATREFDILIANGFFELVLEVNLPNTPEARRAITQLRLPFHLTGLGLRSMEELCPVAFLTSFNKHHQSVQDYAARLGIRLPDSFYRGYERAIHAVHSIEPAALSVADLRRAVDQASLTQKIDLLRYRSFLHTSPDRSKARVLSQFDPDHTRVPSAWITAAASPTTPEQHFSSSVFRLNLLLHLGLPLPLLPEMSSNMVCNGCNEPIDAIGNHFFGCDKMAFGGIRTSHLHDPVARFTANWVARMLKVTVKHDPTHQVQKTQQRPGDIIIGPAQLTWLQGVASHGITHYGDISVPHPACLTHLPLAKDKPGATADKKAREKHVNFRKIDPASIANHHAFNALVIETYGHMHKEFRDYVWGISKQSAENAFGIVGNEALVKANAKRIQKAFYIDLSCVLAQNRAYYIQAALSRCSPF